MLIEKKKQEKQQDVVESSSNEDDQDESGEDESLSCSDKEEEIKIPKHAPNDIIWAKVRGHAWWPAKVGEICTGVTLNHFGGKPSNDIKYLIFFIGDHTRSQLNEKNTRKFE